MLITSQRFWTSKGIPRGMKVGELLKFISENPMEIKESDNLVVKIEINENTKLYKINSITIDQNGDISFTLCNYLSGMGEDLSPYNQERLKMAMED